MSNPFYAYAIPASAIEGFWTRPEKRLSHLSRCGGPLTAGGTRDHRGSRISPATIMRERDHSILHADKVYFEAMRMEACKMREACAIAAEDAGHPDIAAIIRGQVVPDWSGP